MDELESEKRREEEVISLHRKYIQSLFKHKAIRDQSAPVNGRQKMLTNNIMSNYQSRDTIAKM